MFAHLHEWLGGLPGGEQDGRFHPAPGLKAAHTVAAHLEPPDCLLRSVVGERDIRLHEAQPIVGPTVLQPPYQAPEFVDCCVVFPMCPPFPRQALPYLEELNCAVCWQCAPS